MDEEEEEEEFVSEPETSVESKKNDESPAEEANKQKEEIKSDAPTSDAADKETSSDTLETEGTSKDETEVAPKTPEKPAETAEKPKAAKKPADDDSDDDSSSEIIVPSVPKAPTTWPELPTKVDPESVKTAQDKEWWDDEILRVAIAQLTAEELDDEL